MQVQTVTPQPGVSGLSDSFIPAVPGEFYNYKAVFTQGRPLGYLMKCRANKDRKIDFAENYADELDLTFLFEEGAVRVCSPRSPESFRLLCDRVLVEDLHDTRLVAANISETTFDDLRREKNGARLAEVCRQAVVGHSGDQLKLTPGMIVAVETATGKYGLLAVRELTPHSVRVEACHILI